jgi:hypothetical protein
MAVSKGGARPGAGRKPKAEKYSRDINAAEKKIRDSLPDIVDAQIALAKGLKTTTAEGGVYTTVPDKAAGQYLMNRIMGSPIQKQEISGSIESITVKYVDPI